MRSVACASRAVMKCVPDEMLMSSRMNCSAVLARCDKVTPGGARYGLGLWRSVPGTLAVELAMFALGALIYTRATRATGPLGRWGWPALAGLLAVAFVITTLGPPPPSIDALLAAMGAMLVIVLAASIAIDRQRPAR